MTIIFIYSNSQNLPLIMIQTYFIFSFFIGGGDSQDVEEISDNIFGTCWGGSLKSNKNICFISYVFQ